MKLGFIAGTTLEQIEKDAAFAVEQGYRGLEFNYWAPFAELTDETVAAMRAILDRYQVECSTLGLWGWNHISADPAERKLAHEMLGRAIGYAGVLGAPVLITGGGSNGGETAAAVAEFAQVMPPYLEAAAAKSIQVALYGFHGGSFLSTVDAYEALWEQVPEVGIKLDPANLDHAGEDYLRVLRHHAERVYHVHIKEHLTYGGELATQPAAGMGDIQWGKVMAFLHEADYQGYLTVEPHGPKWGREPLRTKMLLLTKKYLEQFLI